MEGGGVGGEVFVGVRGGLGGGFGKGGFGYKGGVGCWFGCKGGVGGWFG